MNHQFALQNLTPHRKAQKLDPDLEFVLWNSPGSITTNFSAEPTCKIFALCLLKFGMIADSWCYNYGLRGGVKLERSLKMWLLCLKVQTSPNCNISRDSLACKSKFVAMTQVSSHPILIHNQAADWYSRIQWVFRIIIQPKLPIYHPMAPQQSSIRWGEG